MSRISIVFVGLVSLTACGGVDTEPLPDAAPPPSLAGTWQVQSGDLFALGNSGLDRVDFVELDPALDGARAGSGQLFASSESGLIACAPLVYSEPDGDAITLSVPQLSPPDVRIVEHDGDDHAIVTDAFGNQSELVRVDEVPAASRCVEASIDNMFDLPAPVASFTGLVNDGSRLWYEASDKTWIPFNPATNEFEAAVPVPTTAGQFTHIHAFQGGDFWTHCGCGGSESAKRINPTTGDTIDTVDTSGLPTTISVRGIAFDGTNLILAGFDFDGNGIKVLTINLGANPHTILSEVAPSFSSNTLGLHGSEIWTQTQALGINLVQFNPADGSVLRTIKMPDDVGISVFSLAFTWFGNKVYAVGRRDSGNDVMLEITVP